MYMFGFASDVSRRHGETRTACFAVTPITRRNRCTQRDQQNCRCNENPTRFRAINRGNMRTRGECHCDRRVSLDILHILVCLPLVHIQLLYNTIVSVRPV